MFSEIREFLSLSRDFIGAATSGGNKGIAFKRNLRSLSSASSDSIFYFPVVVSNQVTLDEVKMTTKALEKQYASFLASVISLYPYESIDEGEEVSVQEYLRSFHQNIGIKKATNVGGIMSSLMRFGESVQCDDPEVGARKYIESAYRRSLEKASTIIEVMREDASLVNSIQGAPDYLDSYARHLLNKMNEALNSGISTDLEDGIADPSDFDRVRMDTFSKEVFTNTEMKKANELVPTFVRAKIGFIIRGSGRVIEHEILVGVKTYVHKVETMELIEDIYQTISKKQKFLKFIKFVTGEENSLSELLLGMKSIKYDVALAKKQGVSNNQLAMIKKRSRWRDMSVPYIMKNYMPNSSIVMTMNEVSYLKNRMGIDIFSNNNITKIMDDNYLLGFVVLDQSNESAFISYESHNYKFQEYPYATLEKELVDSDRMMREMYREFSGRR
jgi:hypothetical protein